ncbi:hypothetical protein Dimus_025303, partial [Dionaea muscipula]
FRWPRLPPLAEDTRARSLHLQPHDAADREARRSPVMLLAPRGGRPLTAVAHVRGGRRGEVQCLLKEGAARRQDPLAVKTRRSLLAAEGLTSPSPLEGLVARSIEAARMMGL